MNWFKVNEKYILISNFNNNEEDSSDDSSLELYMESGDSSDMDDDLCVTSAHYNTHQPVFLSREEKLALV